MIFGLRAFKWAGCALLSLAASGALAQNLSGQTQTINAGVVVLEADRPSVDGFARSSAPFAWLNLDRSPRLKPAGWVFANPAAPTVMTAPLRARWNAIHAALGGAAANSGVPVGSVGSTIDKTKAAYWEVFLSQVSDERLAQYDALLVAPRFFASLNSAEREKLRRFVDGGGVLWIEVGAMAGPIDVVNNFPIAFGVNSANGENQFDFTQSLLARPNRISFIEALAMNNALPGKGLTNASYGVAGGIFASLEEEARRLQPVALTGGVPSVAVGRIGDGFIVVSSQGLANALGGNAANFSLGVDANAALQALDVDLTPAGVAAGRFAVNLVSLRNEFNQTSGGTRRTSGSPIDVPAPLLQRFAIPEDLPESARSQSPTIYKGVGFMVVGGDLIAFDLNPESDLDRDGFTDDGLADLSLGSTADIVWRFPVGSGASSPVAFEVPDAPAGVARDQVAIVDAAGNLRVFNALPRDANGTLLATTTQLYQLAPPSAPSAGRPIIPPTVHESWIVVADQVQRAGGQQGRLWIVDASTGERVRSTSDFVFGGGVTGVTLAPFSAGPTIGYVPILDNSGGVDRIAYVPLAPTNSGGSANPSGTAGFASVWIGAKGEKPVNVEINATGLIVNTRASQQGGLPIYVANTKYAPRLSVIDAAGNPLSASQMQQFFSAAPVDAGGGVLIFPFRSGAPGWNSDWSVRVDYSIDYGSGVAGSLQSAVRGQINFPDADGSRRVIGNLVLSPRGTLFATVSDGQTGKGGGLYGFKEEGRGAFRCTLRYELHDAHSFQASGGGTQNVPAVLQDTDPVNAFLPGDPNSPERALTGFSLRTAPSYANGQIHVGASALKRITVPGFGSVPIPVTVLMAFNAEPPAPEIPVGTLSAGFSLVQPDIAQSLNKSVPERQSVLQQGQLTYDAGRGTVRVDNLMGAVRGPMANSLSLSQPLIIRQNGVPDQVLQPDSVNARWTPLQWFTVINGMELPAGSNSTPASAVFTAGNTLYVAGRTNLYNILTGQGLGNQGAVQAFDAVIPSNDPGLRANSARPWIRQLWHIIPDGAGVRGNAHVRWPQLSGVQGLEDFVIRLGQTVLPGSDVAYGVIGGERAAVTWANSGIYGFNQADIVIADQGRVGIYDSVGNATFTADSTAAAGSTGESGAAQVRKLVRPTRAYTLPGGEMAIVDAGANRVTVVGADGRERRSIARFRLDPNFIPTDYPSNAPTDLRSPRDVAIWEQYVSRGAQAVVTDQQPLEYWIHYLIADSGNRRLIEVVDRYRVDASGRVLEPIQVDGTPQLGVLRWHSPAGVSGGNFEYLSVQRVWLPGGTGRFVFVAGVGRDSATRANLGLDSAPGGNNTPSNAGNGNVVVFDPLDPRGALVFDRVQTPSLANTPLWSSALGRLATAQETGDAVLISRRGDGVRPFRSLASVTARATNIGGNSVLLVMVADGEGLVEFPIGPATTVPSASWMLPREAYIGMRRLSATALAGRSPTDFRPTYARRLDSGEVLVVNGYVGRLRNGNAFAGEVLQIDGQTFNPGQPNAGFGLASIRFELGGVNRTRPLVQPVFADRR